MSGTREDMRQGMATMEKIWANPDKAIIEAIRDHKYPENKTKKGKGKK